MVVACDCATSASASSPSTAMRAAMIPIDDVPALRNRIMFFM
jgi:hypothetical protein